MKPMRLLCCCPHWLQTLPLSPPLPFMPHLDHNILCSDRLVFGVWPAWHGSELYFRMHTRKPNWGLGQRFPAFGSDGV
jgi:hypothetical protein